MYKKQQSEIIEIICQFIDEELTEKEVCSIGLWDYPGYHFNFQNAHLKNKELNFKYIDPIIDEEYCYQYQFVYNTFPNMKTQVTEGTLETEAELEVEYWLSADLPINFPRLNSDFFTSYNDEFFGQEIVKKLKEKYPKLLVMYFNIELIEEEVIEFNQKLNTSNN